MQARDFAQRFLQDQSLIEGGDDDGYFQHGGSQKNKMPFGLV
jgi:hypothetical protein